MVKQAVVLAAGEGERLRPLTAYKPKVMIPVGNKPILQYVIEALVESGIREIILVVGYRKEAVMRFFEDGRELGARIEYVFQSAQLGTGHALKQAEGKTEGTFLVLSGDNIIAKETLSPILDMEQPSVLAKEGEEAGKYGVLITRDDELVEIVEKPTQPPSFLLNTGIYILPQAIFEYLREELDLPKAISSMVSDGVKVKVRITDGVWLDALYPWDLLKLNSFVLRRTSPSISGRVEKGVVIKGDVIIGEGTRIRSNSYIAGPVVIGRNCEIGPNVCIFPSTSIGDGSRIFPFSEIRNSILGEGVTIWTGSLITSSIIDNFSSLGARASLTEDEVVVRVNGEERRVRMGIIVGEGCKIGENVVIRAGVRVGNRVRVRGLKVIDEDIPDNTLVL